VNSVFRHEPGKLGEIYGRATADAASGKPG
jgi:hypothetical protein